MVIAPNPIKDFANVQISMTDGIRANSTIELFDVLGRKIKTVFDGYLMNGNSIFMNLQDLPYGVYYCTLTTNNERVTQQLTITH
jgi:hypothetical protein